LSEARNFLASKLKDRANARETDATELRQLIFAFQPSNLSYTSILLLLPLSILYIAFAAIVIVVRWVFHAFRGQAQ
jgi:hypothetical protein